MRIKLIKLVGVKSIFKYLSNSILLTLSYQFDFIFAYIINIK